MEAMFLKPIVIPHWKALQWRFGLEKLMKEKNN